MTCMTMPERVDFLKRLQDRDVIARSTVPFQGGVQDLPVYLVPIELPCYRLANGRTRAVQAEYKVTRGLQKDFFDDPDSATALDVQDELLSKMVDDKNLLGVLRTEPQTDALILDNRGYVVNGNRRLCAMRTLLAEDSVMFKHFRNVRVAILPTCTEEQIRELEARLQIKPDTKADYTWVDLAMMQRSLRDGGMSDPEIADLYGIKQRSAVVQSIEMLSLADAYLSSRGWDGQYSKVSGSNDYAFSQLLKGRRIAPSESERDALTQLTFLLVDNPEGGRLYERVPDLAKNMKRVVEQLKAEMDVPVPAPVPNKLFGGVEDGLSLDCAGVVELLEDPYSHEKAREIVKNELERIDRLAREEKGARFCLKCVADAHTMLENALNGYDESSVTEGVLAHLENIELLAGKLRQKVNELRKPRLRQ